MNSLYKHDQPTGGEQKLVVELTRFLKDKNYNVRLEVPNLGQSVDIVATRGRWVTLIEVKVHDWRTAMSQCRAHELVADFVCIVVGTKRISHKAIHEIGTKGYGLIHYDKEGHFKWILQPERNQFIWRPQREKLSLVLRKINYVE